MQLRSGKAVTDSGTMREARLALPLHALTLNPLLELLDVISLIRLRCCSKYLSSSVLSFLQHSLQAPLIPAVLAVAASEQKEHEEQLDSERHGRLQRQDGPHPRAVQARCQCAVYWLCHRAGSDAVARVPASAVLSLPNTSLLLANSLINSGLRVSYADVLAAAKQGVCGTDAWVAAVHHRATATGRSSGISELAVALSYLVSMFCVSALSPCHCGVSRALCTVHNHDYTCMDVHLRAS
jgi:hypothetical protein